MNHLETLLKEFLDERTVEFVMSQVWQSQKNPKGRRWSADQKSLAMSLYHTSPKAYAMLRGLFNLPPESTLKRELRELEVIIVVYTMVTEKVTTKNQFYA